MKQRVVVQAIIQRKGKTLLLRRSLGRPELIGKYELPGGRLDTNEQPEDSIRRRLQSDTGLSAKNIRLFDVVSISDDEEGNVQHVLLVYLVEVESSIKAIKLGSSYDKYEWLKISAMNGTLLRDSARVILGLVVQDKAETTRPPHSGGAESSSDITKPKIDKSHVIVYSDGGSRGNPGPSAAGFVILDQNENVIDQGGVFLGITTNNQAEYHGVQLGLEHALAMGARFVEFNIDSMLVVNQMNGIYKIKNRELWPIHERIRDLSSKFDKVSFTHVPRELNRLADGMVNKILDEHQLDSL
ncbi:MAG TPA: reverse transcriptase-like protein [Candidatus Saccharibacteria bacterium]|nr:reverse transcriptase-like protein [Candidatus Saccharibacteria bacterium]HRQ98105.1 reverse transcriptase-like protein [Candidatus Saccharibacteria bacterium]